MSGDFRNYPRCSAHTKSRQGEPCRQIAMANGRCYLHGGKSTGPRTQEGLQRMKQSKIKHGFFSKEHIEERRRFRLELQRKKEELKNILDSL